MDWEKEYEHMRDYGHTWGPGLEGDSEPSEPEVSEAAARRQAFEEKRAKLRVEPSDVAVQGRKELEERFSGSSVYEEARVYNQEQLNYAKKVAQGLGYDLVCCSLRDRDKDKFTVSIEFHGHVSGEGGSIHKFSAVDVDNIKDCLQLVEDFSELGYWSTTWHKDYHISLKDSGDLRLEMVRWGFPLELDKNNVEIFEYEQNAKERYGDLVDVLSPQECADIFSKPVKDGDKIYFPCEQGKVALDEQISRAKANKPIQAENDVKKNLNQER